MIIVKANNESEAGVMPDETMMASMAGYHEELAKAGVLVDASGLQASSKGWRIQYAETKQLIAGYTIIKVQSREEALDWTMRFPNPELAAGDCVIEVRRMFELEDFEQNEAVNRFRELGVGEES